MLSQNIVGHGLPRVDDRRVLSGIMYVIRNELRENQ